MPEPSLRSCTGNQNRSEERERAAVKPSEKESKAEDCTIYPAKSIGNRKVAKTTTTTTTTAIGATSCCCCSYCCCFCCCCCRCFRQTTATPPTRQQTKIPNCGMLSSSVSSSRQCPQKCWENERAKTNGKIPFRKLQLPFQLSPSHSSYTFDWLDFAAGEWALAAAAVAVASR